MDKQAESRFWRSNSLSREEVTDAIAQLRVIADNITRSHLGYDWTWTMIAVDEETEELLDALMWASSR